MTLRILRSGGFKDYEVEQAPGMTILDALEVIRRLLEPGLRYRHSCHHGSCGTCAGLVNGKERLFCITPLADAGPGPITVEPLRKMGLVGDLVVEPSRLFEEMPDGAGYLRPSSRGPAANGVFDGERAVELDACIECGICVSACPVTAPFAGPAALAAADSDRWANPGREQAALDFASGPRGVEACDRKFACTRACPQGVDPGRRIAALRRSLAERAERTGEGAT